MARNRNNYVIESKINCHSSGFTKEAVGSSEMNQFVTRVEKIHASTFSLLWIYCNPTIPMVSRKRQFVVRI